MALTRKFLKAMGIEEEKIEQIIDAHTEVTDSLKAERDSYKEKADELETVKAELSGLKAKGDDGYKEKYDSVNAELTALKTKLATEADHKAKLDAVTAYYEGKNITGKNLAIAMRGTNVDSFELDGDKLKDTTVLDELIAGDFATLVATGGVKGAEVPKPPAKGDFDNLSKDEIMKITDRDERLEQIAKHIDLFKK